MERACVNNAHRQSEELVKQLQKTDAESQKERRPAELCGKFIHGIRALEIFCTIDSCVDFVVDDIKRIIQVEI